MNWVFASIIALTIGQVASCGFSFAALLSIIGRLVFFLRMVGSVVPGKVSMGFEAANLFFVFLGIVFSKHGVDWVGVLLSLLFCGLVCLLYVIDDRFYLYVVADDDREEE